MMTAAVDPNRVANAVYDNKLLRGGLCGSSAKGSGGKGGIVMLASQTVAYTACAKTVLGVCVWPKVIVGDGYVANDECMKDGRGNWIGGVAFTRTYTDAFYDFQGNHLDSTGYGKNQDHFYDFLRAQIAKP